MRIVHAIWSLDPAQGGPPAVAERLARAQQQLGHEVRLAAQVVPSQQVNTVTLPAHGMRDLWRGPCPAVMQLVSAADVLHLHGVWEPVLACIAKACRLQHIPYFIAPHGMLDPWSLSQKKWKKRLALALGHRAMLNGAAALHVLNDDEQALLAPLQLKAPCATIPNGIFLDEVQDDPAAFRASHPELGDRPYLLFLSRLHYKKGLDYLADAFAQIAPRFPAVDLVVAGPDDGAATPFRSQIDRLGLSARLRLTGPLYGAQKWSCLAGATCFVLPSRQEGFSMAILEAMACRLPVVISEACHFPEVAATGAGHVVALDATAVATAIAAVLSDPASRTRMGVAGRNLVETRFTWPQVAARSVEVYQQFTALDQTGYTTVPRARTPT